MVNGDGGIMATQNAIDNRINGAAGAVVTSTVGALSVQDGSTSGKILTSTGTNSIPTFATYTPSTGTTIILPSLIPAGTISAVGAVRYHPVTIRTPSATEAPAQQIVPVACTFKNLYANITTNGSTTDTTITLRVNGASSALVATATASTTGVFSDTTHSVSVNAGDLVSIEIGSSTTSTVQGNWSLVIET